jgi:hypothetical protein
MFAYAMVGMELYAYKVYFKEENEIFYVSDSEEGESPRLNFDSIWNAFIVIFIIFIGEDWHSVYYQFYRVKRYTSIFYFVSLSVFGNIIMLNLFLAIMLKNFEHKTKSKKKSITFTSH